MKPCTKQLADLRRLAPLSRRCASVLCWYEAGWLEIDTE
jgi:hypothetical protein